MNYQLIIINKESPKINFIEFIFFLKYVHYWTRYGYFYSDLFEEKLW